MVVADNFAFPCETAYHMRLKPKPMRHNLAREDHEDIVVRDWITRPMSETVLYDMRHSIPPLLERIWLAYSAAADSIKRDPEAIFLMLDRARLSTRSLRANHQQPS